MAVWYNWYGWPGNDFRILRCLIGFSRNTGLWWSPIWTLCGAALPVFASNIWCLINKMMFDKSWMMLSTRGTVNATGILDYIVLLDGLNGWSGRLKVVPWPILFEQFVPKQMQNQFAHTYSRPHLLVCVYTRIRANVLGLIHLKLSWNLSKSCPRAERSTVCV